MKKLVFLLSFLLISSVSAFEPVMEMWTLWTDSKVWTQDASIQQDGSVMTNGSSVQENNVGAGNVQVTDEQVVAWDQVINMWTETTLSPISEETIDLNSAWLAWESNSSWVTMWNVEVKNLPTTWLEESFLIIASLLLSWFLIFRNRFIKK